MALALVVAGVIPELAAGPDTGTTKTVTFAKDVAPILQAKCQTCHRPGTVAPMSLLTYEAARPWARSIRDRVARREMPPWHIDRTQGIQEFKNDRSLTDEEVATIVKWVDGGALPGDPRDLPPAAQFPNEDEWAIGKPDLILQTPEHVVPAKGADEWYEVVVPTGLTEDRYVKAIETKPSKDGRFVEHHAVVSVYQDEDPFTGNGTGAGQRAGQQGSGRVQPQPGRHKILSNFSEYVVGKYGDIFADGSGRLLKAGSELHFNMHYHSIGEEHHDRATIGLVFYPKGVVPKYISRWITVFPEDYNDLEIPPGQVTRVEGFYRLPKPTRIDGFEPHMHMPGKAMCLEAIYPNTVIDPENVPVNTRGGTRKVMLACVDRFDFNWQVAYDFKDDVAPLLPAGSILHQVSIFDNTASNRHNPDSTVWVGYGQRSIDEMDNAHVTAVFLSDEDYNREVAKRKAKQDQQKEPTIISRSVTEPAR